jgi:MFS family permease
MLIGVFFETLALIAASFSTRIWHLFLSQGVCFGIGMGFLFVASVGIVPQWFTKRRSFANGIGTAGSGIGGLTYSLATGAMIPRLGIGWAFRILGIVSGSVNVVCAILIRDRNKQIGSSQIAFDHRLFKRTEFVFLLAWGSFSMLGYVALLFTLPNYALSVGLTAQQGSVIGALLNLGQGLGRPVVGIISDRFGRINICTMLTFLCGFFCLVIWIFAVSYGVLIFFAIIGGTVAGTIWVTIAPVGAEVVGLRELPSALSVAWLVFALPATVAEPIALELRQASGPIYLHAQIYTGMMYVGAAICMWYVRAWKVAELEIVAAAAGKPLNEIDPTQSASITIAARTSDHPKPTSIVKRLITWKKV